MRLVGWLRRPLLLLLLLGMVRPACLLGVRRDAAVVLLGRWAGPMAPLLIWRYGPCWVLHRRIRRWLLLQPRLTQGARLGVLHGRLWSKVRGRLVCPWLGRVWLRPRVLTGCNTCRGRKGLLLVSKRLELLLLLLLV
jgi:hypothetical protein